MKADARIQSLFERMVDECHVGVLRLIRWRRAGGEAVLEYVLHRMNGVQKTYFSLRYAATGEMVTVTHLGFSPLGRLVSEKLTSVTLTPIPSAVLAVALR